MTQRWTVRCPDCQREIRDGRWVEPGTGREYQGVLEHQSGCRIYREREFDPALGIAHLQLLSVRRVLTA